MKLFTPIIESVSYDQQSIISDIMHLRGIDRFDADVTYAHGGFWKGLPEPVHKLDIDPQTVDTVQGDSTDLPFGDGGLSSVMFDPPFLTYIRSREGGSVMGKRFGGYWTYDDLETHYKGTLRELGRVVDSGGTVVVKCQDIIHNHRMHATHINVVGWASEWFRLADLFLLLAKNRMPTQEGSQRHARIHHSYFLVFERVNGADNE